MSNVGSERGSSGLDGRVLAGRYRVARTVSTGENTVIFDAIDLDGDRPVTLKLVRPERAEDPDFRHKFRRLAEISNALTHPNIASVLDWGEIEINGASTVFYTVEALGGGSLRDLLDRGRLLEPGQALVVGLETCRALDAAHQKGLFHTELTPSKMVFGADRRLRVVDFGMARLLGERSWQDVSSVPTHTARYASPEQALGLPIDAKTDVYALSLVLVESVTGAVPFAGDSTQATLAGRIDRLLPVSADLGALAAVLERAARPESPDRFTAAEFGRALVQAAAKLPKPEPVPILTTGRFDTTSMRRPGDPTGGVARPTDTPEGPDGGADPARATTDRDEPGPDPAARDLAPTPVPGAPGPDGSVATSAGGSAPSAAVGAVGVAAAATAVGLGGSAAAPVGDGTGRTGDDDGSGDDDAVAPTASSDDASGGVVPPDGDTVDETPRDDVPGDGDERGDVVAAIDDGERDEPDGDAEDGSGRAHGDVGDDTSSTADADVVPPATPAGAVTGIAAMTGAAAAAGAAGAVAASGHDAPPRNDAGRADVDDSDAHDAEESTDVLPPAEHDSSADPSGEPTESDETADPVAGTETDSNAPAGAATPTGTDAETETADSETVDAGTVDAGTVDAVNGDAGTVDADAGPDGLTDVDRDDASDRDVDGDEDRDGDGDPHPDPDPDDLRLRAEVGPNGTAQMPATLAASAQAATMPTAALGVTEAVAPAGVVTGSGPVAPAPALFDDPEYGVDGTGEIYDDRPARSRRTGPIVLLVLLLLAGLGGLGYAASLLLQTKSYAVPELAGATEGEARNLIEGNDWDIDVSRERSDSFPDLDQVIRSEPGPGTELEEGESITLVLSDGFEFRTLPDVADLTVEAATAQLQSLRLEAVEAPERVFSEDVPAGTVVSWEVVGDASLTAGAQVLPGETVSLTVSQGPEPRAVPDLSGQTLADATAALSGLQLEIVVGEEVFSDTVELGRVVSQAPAVGEQVERGGSVTVQVSRGPDTIAIPDLEGQSFTDASALLTDAGFTIGRLLGTTQGTFVQISVGGEQVEPGTRFPRGQIVDLIFL